MLFLKHQLQYGAYPLVYPPITIGPAGHLLESVRGQDLWGERLGFAYTQYRQNGLRIYTIPRLYLTLGRHVSILA